MFPLFLDDAKVIEYTNEGDFGSRYGKEINYLAIGHYENDEGFYLFLCDADKNVIDDFLFNSMTELKNAYIDTDVMIKIRDVNWITTKI